MKIVRLYIALAMLAAAVPPGLQAAEYFVDQQNAAANDQNAGTSDKPWKTISRANQVLVAGDTVYIKAGTYTSYIAPQNSGTASAPITYRSYGSDIVTISNATYGILLSGKSWIVVEGLNFNLLDQFLRIVNSANHNTVSRCNFDQGRNMGWSGSLIAGNSQYNYVHHCRFSKYGSIGGSASGTVLDIGDEESQSDGTKYNRIEDNVMYHGGHHVIGIMGQYNVVRNNYFHNEAWSNGYGYRVLYLNGYALNSGWNLIEGNRIGYAGAYEADNNSAGMLLASTHNIVRNNCFFYNDGSAIALSANTNYISDIVFNKIYSNTFLRNGWDADMIPDAMTSAIGFAVYGGSWVVKNNSVRNNLFSSHYQVFGTYRVSLSDQQMAGNWDADSQGDPGFVNAGSTPGNPLSPDYPDLSLKTGSPCIDAGTFLTTITSGSGSGSSLQVADSGYFFDGWGIAELQGDEIQIQGSSLKARVTQVNYSTNTLTLDRSVTWKQNDGIALAYAGAAPDPGALEAFSAANLPPAAPKNLRVKLP